MIKNMKLLSVLILLASALSNFAAISTDTTTFWKKLRAGQSVNLLIYGSSRSIDAKGKWPVLLKAKIDSLYPGKATFTNWAVDGGGSIESFYTDIITNNKLTGKTFDALIIETCFRDAWEATALGVLEDKMQQVLTKFTTLYPTISIVYYFTHLYAPENQCQGVPFYNDCRCVDPRTRWNPLRDSYRTQIANRNQYAYDIYDYYNNLSCILPQNQWRAYFYDDSHPSDSCARAIIAPGFFKVLSGTTDKTPPLQSPSGLAATVLSDHSVRLSWSACAANSDPESGILGYAVYRDNVRTAMVIGRTTTTFTDSALRENTTYFFTVAALNGEYLAGTQSSAVSAKTSPDVSAPQIAKVSADGINTVVDILFNESMSKTSVETVSKYAINNSVSITAAALQGDNRTVKLTTSALSENITYTLTVTGVTDVASTPNSFTGSKTFSFQVFLTGLNYNYFTFTTNIWTMPNYGSITPKYSDVINNFSIANRADLNWFGYLFSGYIDIPATGWYTFYLRSDDGAILSIDSDTIVNIDGVHGSVEAADSVYLLMGKHPISLAYFCSWHNTFNEAVLQLQWSYTGVSKSSIPDSKLFHKPTAATELKINITSPQTGARYQISQNLPVRWVNLIGDNRSIVFKISFDDGVSWKSMRSSAISADSLKFDWTIPATFSGVSTKSTTVYLQASDYLDPNITTSIGPFTITDQTGIQKVVSFVDKKLSISVQPHVIVLYNLPVAISVTLCDRLGRAVIHVSATSALRNEVSLNTQHLANGTYFLRCSGKNISYVKPLTIVK